MDVAVSLLYREVELAEQERFVTFAPSKVRFCLHKDPQNF
jgi:hypothetical protein